MDELEQAMHEPRPTYVRHEPIHEWFGLTYANYLVLPRSLLQSMPVEWQRVFILCVDQLDESYSHIERPDVYDVRVRGARGRLARDPIPHYNRGRTYIAPKGPPRSLFLLDVERERQDCIRDTCVTCAGNFDGSGGWHIARSADGTRAQLHHSFDVVLGFVCERRGEGLDSPHCWRCPAEEIHFRALALGMLSEFYDPDGARRWLEARHPLLGGETPRDRIAQGLWPSVFQVIHQLQTGAFA